MNDDISIARRYISKQDNAKEKGHDFELSFKEYKRMALQTHCKYTGLKFCEYDKNGKPISEFTMRTIDRIDNSKGYISGNCVAVCKWINTLKGVCENPTSPLTEDNLMKALIEIKRLRKISDFDLT